jgi:hypothetical protein
MTKTIIIPAFVLYACNYNAEEINGKSEYPSANELKYKVNENKNFGKQEKLALNYFGNYYYNYFIDLRLIS